MYVHTETTQLFLAALSIAKIWENPNVHQQVDKQIMTCPHSGTLYSNRKNPTTDTNNKDGHCAKGDSETRRTTCCLAPFTWKPRKGKVTQTVGSQGWEREEGHTRECGSFRAKEHQGSFGAMEMLTGCGDHAQLYVVVV